MQLPRKIRLVCASRASREDFLGKSALGRSLALYRYKQVELRLFDRNTAGLPVVYNRAIDEARDDPAILVFIHDDIHLCDFFWPEHLFHALGRFDLVGLAGNRRRVPNQPGWAFVELKDGKLAWDSQDNLSGVVGHGHGFPPANLSFFGPPGQPVKLLDGLLLCCASPTLHARDLRFDERFDFHFYDLDLCRQAERKDVRMGTWPISVVHESGGSFMSASWQAAYRAYLDKWGS